MADTTIPTWSFGESLKYYESVFAKETNTAFEGISHSSWNKPVNEGLSFGEGLRSGGLGIAKYNPAMMGVFQYPIDLDTQQDHLQIQQYKYQRPNTGGQGNNQRGSRFSRMNASGPTGSVAAGGVKATILLPMPKVSDSNGAKWGQSDMNAITMMGAQAAGGLMGQVEGPKQQKAFDDAVKKARQGDPGEGNAGGIALAVGAGAASKAVSLLGQNVSPDEILARSRGQILNPNVELVFSGPSLREFSFNFLLLARSRREGDVIRKIIRTFKIGIAPKHNNSALLTNPDVWQLTYRRGASPLKNVNRFGQMGLKDMTVDYAPDGYWAAYDDSQPVACRLSLNFAEVRPIYQQEQEETPADSVGY